MTHYRCIFDQVQGFFNDRKNVFVTGDVSKNNDVFLVHDTDYLIHEHQNEYKCVCEQSVNLRICYIHAIMVI